MATPKHKLDEMDPKELYKFCKDREQKIERTARSGYVRSLAQHLLFLQPLFETAFLAGDEEFRELSRQSYPFDYSLAQHVESREPVTEWRYRRLLRELRKQRDRDFRWLLLARWLKQEGVCEPAEILPERVVSRVVRQFQKRLSISVMDLKHQAMIQNWRPYFERLRVYLRSKHSLRRRREEAVGAGYDPRAVEWADKKRSTTAAIIEWLHECKNIECGTLWNAYSRRHGKARTKTWTKSL